MPFLMTEAHRIRDKILEYCSMVLPAPFTYLQSSIYSTKYQHNNHHHFTTIIQVNQKALSALTLLVERQEGHLACKKSERGANLHMAQLMPLPLTVSRFSKIQIGFTFLVPAHPGSPGQRAVKRVCVYVCVYTGQPVLADTSS